MSRTVCSWCKAPLVLKDDILVCSNIDCPACDEKYLHEELIRTKKQLETTDLALDQLNLEKYDIEDELERTRKALDVAKDTIRHIDWFFDGDYNVDAKTMHNEIKCAIKGITALEQNEHFADASKTIEQKDVK